MAHVRDNIEDAEHHLVAGPEPPVGGEIHRKIDERPDQDQAENHHDRGEHRRVQEDKRKQPASQGDEEGKEHAEADSSRRGDAEMRGLDGLLHLLRFFRIRLQADELFRELAKLLVAGEMRGQHLLAEFLIVLRGWGILLYLALKFFFKPGAVALQKLRVVLFFRHLSFSSCVMKTFRQQHYWRQTAFSPTNNRLRYERGSKEL